MKALIIGLGGVGQRHLRNILEVCPDTEFLSVRKRGRNYEILDDLTIDESVDIMEKYKIRNFQNIDEAIEAKPDIAVVATPSASHTTICTALLEKGIKVLVEKPAATTSFDYNSLAGLGNLNNLYVVHQLRYHSCFIKLKEILESGTMGKVNGVEVSVRSHMPSWHQYENYEDLYAAKEDQGGGVILTEIHEIDLLCFLFGAAEVKYAQESNILNLQVEDTIVSVCEFDYLQMKFLANIRLSFCQLPQDRHFIIYCKNGTLEWRLNGGLTISDDGGETLFQPTERNRNELFIKLTQDFINGNNENLKTCSFSNSTAGLACALKIKDTLNRS
jgi:predicted dehydrogenase